MTVLVRGDEHLDSLTDDWASRFSGYVSNFKDPGIL